MNDQKKGWIWIFCISVFFGLVGAIGMYALGPKQEKIIETKIVERPVIIQGETVHTQSNQIQYVEKERDPLTGEIEKTDAEYQIEAPKVSVKVNGQSADFDLLQGESWKFEKGKLLFHQDSSIKFDFKVPEIDRTKKRSLYYGIGTNGNDEILYSQNVNSRWGFYGGVDGKLLKAGFQGEAAEVENIRIGLKLNW